MNARRRIKITKTQGEWEAIDAYLADEINREWSIFWRKKMASLVEAYKKCPNCVVPATGEKIHRFVEIPEAQYQLLLSMSLTHNTSMSDIADKFALLPILHPNQ